MLVVVFNQNEPSFTLTTKANEWLRFFSSCLQSLSEAAAISWIAICESERGYMKLSGKARGGHSTTKNFRTLVWKINFSFTVFIVCPTERERKAIPSAPSCYSIISKILKNFPLLFLSSVSQCPLCWEVTQKDLQPVGDFGSIFSSLGLCVVPRMEQSYSAHPVKTTYYQSSWLFMYSTIITYIFPTRIPIKILGYVAKQKFRHGNQSHENVSTVQNTKQ